MNEKEALLSWNDAVEVHASAKGCKELIKGALDKLENLITKNSLVGTSKLCYNVGLMSKQIGDLNMSMMVSVSTVPSEIRLVGHLTHQTCLIA